MGRITDKQFERLATISRLYNRDPYLAEFATAIKRPWSTVRYWALEGKIPFYKRERFMHVPLDEIRDWKAPAYKHGAKLRRSDVKTIRARKRKGETMEEVYADYQHRLGAWHFKRVWDGESYQDIA